MIVKVKSSIVVDYLLDNNLSKKAFCDKCDIDLFDLEMIFDGNFASSEVLEKISKVTGLVFEKIVSHNYTNQLPDIVSQCDSDGTPDYILNFKPFDIED